MLWLIICINIDWKTLISIINIVNILNDIYSSWVSFSKILRKAYHDVEFWKSTFCINFCQCSNIVLYRTKYSVNISKLSRRKIEKSCMKIFQWYLITSNLLRSEKLYICFAIWKSTIASFAKIMFKKCKTKQKIKRSLISNNVNVNLLKINHFITQALVNLRFFFKFIFRSFFFHQS